MGIFDKLKSTLTGGVNKFSGRKDFLEAVCAGAALVAAADGDISDDEIDAATKAVSSNRNLSAAFPSREIETTMETMLKRAQGGRVGRNGLYVEIEEITSDAEAAETVLATVLDVAEADGSISDQERAVVDRIANKLRLDVKNYM